MLKESVKLNLAVEKFNNYSELKANTILSNWLHEWMNLTI